MCYHNVRFYIATCDLLLSVRSVEFYPQVTKYATYKKTDNCVGAIWPRKWQV